MAAKYEIRIPVKLDTKTFRRFACFDTLLRRRGLVRPLLFALILIAFAVAALLSKKPQSGLIAGVLLAVGCGLPLVYIGMFLSQVNAQAKKQQLGKGKPVYNVVLRNADFHVISSQKKDEAVTVSWKDADSAYRGRKCIYLYASPRQAFLLPVGQANASDDEVWQMIRRGLGDSRCHRAP